MQLLRRSADDSENLVPRTAGHAPNEVMRLVKTGEHFINNRRSLQIRARNPLFLWFQAPVVGSHHNLCPVRMPLRQSGCR